MCKHEAFVAEAEVKKVGHRMLAGFRLKCRQCRVEFEFINQPFGAATADGLELLSEVRPVVVTTALAATPNVWSSTREARGD